MSVTGPAIATNAMFEAMAARIKGATPEHMMLLAGISAQFAQEAQDTFIHVQSVEDYMDKKIAKFRAQKIYKGNPQYDAFVDRCNRVINNALEYMQRSYEEANAAAAKASKPK